MPFVRQADLCSWRAWVHNATLLVSGRAEKESSHANSAQRNQTAKALSLGAWTGSWTGSPDNPSAVSAIRAITRAIGAASACAAGARASRDA